MTTSCNAGFAGIGASASMELSFSTMVETSADSSLEKYYKETSTMTFTVPPMTEYKVEVIKGTFLDYCGDTTSFMGKDYEIT